MSRFGKHQLHELYYYLKLTRSLEEELARLFGAGKLSGALPISTGQEALSLGATYPLRAQDVLASAVPCNTALLARGVTPFEILTHFMARRGSPSGGRDGSIQFCNLKRGLVAPTEHPAAHVAVMAGVAFAAKVQRKDWVALALVGERALATGDFHEGLNFASVHQLPLVVVIEKKPLDPAAAAYVAPAGQNHYERLKAYGLPTVTSFDPDGLIGQVSDRAGEPELESPRSDEESIAYTLDPPLDARDDAGGRLPGHRSSVSRGPRAAG